MTAACHTNNKRLTQCLNTRQRQKVQNSKQNKYAICFFSCTQRSDVSDRLLKLEACSFADESTTVGLLHPPSSPKATQGFKGHYTRHVSAGHGTEERKQAKKTKKIDGGVLWELSRERAPAHRPLILFPLYLVTLK